MAQGENACVPFANARHARPVVRYHTAAANIGPNESYKDWETAHAGGSHTTYHSLPVLRGGSFVARRLGINNLKDVP